MPITARPRFQRTGRASTQSARVAQEALAQLRADRELAEARIRMANRAARTTAAWKVTYVMPDNFGPRELTRTIADVDLVEFLTEGIGPKTFRINGAVIPNRNRVLRIEAA